MNRDPELTSGGDTQLHYHLADRSTPTSLQAQEKVKSVSAAYSVSYNDDYIFVTAASPLTITLPLAKGRVITVVRVSGASTVTVAATSPNTINGAASVAITASYTPLRLKGVSGTGYVQV